MERENFLRKTIQELTDDDIVMILCEELDLGMSKPYYTMEAILGQHEATFVSKSEVMNVYFDDIINCFDANEDIVNYIEELRNKWNV